MKYQVKQNGLWGDKALSDYEARRGLYGTAGPSDPEYRLPYNHVPTVEELTEMLEGLQPRQERRVTFHTGPRGRENLIRAFEEEFNNQINLEIEREGQIRERDLNYMRLQRGDITPLEYLDLLSEEE